MFCVDKIAKMYLFLSYSSLFSLNVLRIVQLSESVIPVFLFLTSFGYFLYKFRDRCNLHHLGLKSKNTCDRFTVSVERIQF